MKAVVVLRLGGKWKGREILMSLIMTAGCVLVQRREIRARKFGWVTWSGSRPWKITGTGLEV
jgi:hypothetical protein